jgi:hypothetical protein
LPVYFLTFNSVFRIFNSPKSEFFQKLAIEEYRCKKQGIHEKGEFDLDDMEGK